MQRLILMFSLLAVMLIGLPLLGVFLAGHPLDRYLEFPPESRYVQHAADSGVAFALYTIFILSTTIPLAFRAIRAYRRSRARKRAVAPFPWWGWTGVAAGAITWILAWSRFPWFYKLQPHTFSPLWFSYILVVNGLQLRQTGGCMLTKRPRYFIWLFPVSAIFWWFFEYLNRFVQNWHYEGVSFGPSEYFWFATLSFSTVLPAVLGTRDLLLNAKWLQNGFKQFAPLQPTRPRRLAWLCVCGASLGLAGMGVFPNYLFSMVWIAPLIIILSLQTLMGSRHLLEDLVTGDWRMVIASAAAAVICGGFWEMWNYYSMARWVYTIPFVHRFAIFEMPLLGYAGYLPFGVACAVVGHAAERISFDKTD